jgi:hypothetical protein
MKKLNIIFLSGAGGVGKTSVAEQIMKQCQGALSAKLVGSTTRKSYAAMDVKDEKDARLLTPEQLEALQERIFNDYCDNLLLECKNAVFEECDLLIVDRSPYDHISYCLQMLPYLGKSVIDEKLERALEVLDALTHSYSDSDQEVTLTAWFFSYPTSWTVDESLNKWQRYAPAAKNYIWSLALRSMLYTQTRNLHDAVLINEFAEYDAATAVERASTILKMTQS